MGDHRSEAKISSFFKLQPKYNFLTYPFSKSPFLKGLANI